MTTEDRHAVTAAFMEQANGGMVGHPVERPLSTIVGRGTQQRLVEVDCARDDSGRRRQVLDFLWEHFGAPTDAETADPLATAQGRLRFGLVVLGGQVWRIVDVGMRMLVPRELYGAQGFPPTYVIELTWDGWPITKTAQTRMAGNSVSPPPAAALLAANIAWAGVEHWREAA